MLKRLLDEFSKFESLCLINWRKLYKEPIIKNKMFSYNKSVNRIYLTKDKKQLFKKVLYHYLEETRNIIKLLTEFNLTKNQQLIEIGGGIGLTYAYLKQQGYQILSLEPSAPGFDHSYEVGLKILQILQINQNGWLPYWAEDINKIRVRADIIFSHNTLEHIQDLKQIFSVLSNQLKNDGLMIHVTVNYLIPYDPHFKLLLFPFFPKLTQLFKKWLKRSDLWNNLNFITYFSVKRAAEKANLNINCSRKSLMWALDRLNTDKEYGFRHRSFRSTYNNLKLDRISNYLKVVPAALQTPLVFTLTKKRF